MAIFLLSGCSSVVRFSSLNAVKANAYNSLSGKSSVTLAHSDEPDISSTESFDDSRNDDVTQGLASYYSNRFHGRGTASGDIYDKNELTAAHRTLPFGTKVLVRNLRNNLTVVVTINDRGPFTEGRIIDLSEAAAQEIDMLRAGVVEVELKVLE